MSITRLNSGLLPAATPAADPNTTASTAVTVSVMPPSPIVTPAALTAALASISAFNAQPAATQPDSSSDAGTKLEFFNLLAFHVFTLKYFNI